MSDSRTIAAIATAQAPGGIGIVRLSGSSALQIADKVFSAASAAKLIESSGYRAHFGKVVKGEETVDEAVCLVFRAPHSYTGEDTAEIYCHGGLYVTGKVLQTVLEAGAQPAEAGEFTKRAFLNGKLSLDRAEAVMSLVEAQGEQAARAALSALEGNLAKKIKEETSLLIKAVAGISAKIDFPDDEVEQIADEELLSILRGVSERLKKLLETFDTGQVITRGAKTVIAGRPNVGKSTLMNLLTGYERSIVTEHPGTTRDVIEETITLGGLTLRLADTAGLRETDDPVEGIGVELALKKIKNADLVLAVFDGSDVLTAEDKILLEACAGKPSIAIINKTDLPRTLDKEYIAGIADEVVEISAARGEGVETLAEAVSRALGVDGFDPSSAMLANARQRNCCVNAVTLTDEAISGLESGLTLDAVQISCEEAADCLLELTGEKAMSAVVDEIFSSFCVGK